MFKETTKPEIMGMLKIRDLSNDELLVDTTNHIHYENMSLAIAKSLAYRPDGNIHEIHFGNGASMISGTGAITYFPPNITGQNADLYNATYYKVVNDQSPLNLSPTKNFIEVKHLVNTVYTDIITTCTLEYGEPGNQEAFDDSPSANGEFVFDEIGLKTFDTTPGNGLLLTHVIFNPIQKSLNRMIEVVYTLRITMG